MEQLNRINRPAPSGVNVGGGQPNPIHGGGHKKKKNSNLVVIIVAVIVSVLLLALVATVVYKGSMGIGSKIKSDKYQAVFLNSADGQVYFGKLKVLNSEYYELSDIYYVRVEQVQPNPNEQPTQNISLAKLGNEIHGPEDVMYVRKDQVMFWENLKDDGQVVTAINEYIKNGKTTPTNNQNNTNQNTNTPNQEPNTQNSNQ